MTREIGRKPGDCGVQKPNRVPREKQVIISKSADAPKRMIPEKFIGFAKLETNIVRTVSTEGVGIEASLNWTEECEVRQICTTLSKSLVMNREERSMSARTGSLRGKVLSFTKGR